MLSIIYMYISNNLPVNVNHKSEHLFISSIFIFASSRLAIANIIYMYILIVQLSSSSLRMILT